MSWITLSVVPYILEGRTQAHFCLIMIIFFFLNFALPFWKLLTLIFRHEVSEILVSLMQI
jgi:hypothetical protein